MAISYVAGAANEATTITIPAGYQAGDLLVIASFNSGSTSVPSLPAGWSNIDSIADGGNTQGARIGYKFATSAAETSGTWTSAVGLVCQVYRGVVTTRTPFVIGSGHQNSSSNIIGYIGVNVRIAYAWVVSMAYILSVDTAIETPPPSLTNRVDSVTASREYVGFDSNGPLGSRNYVPGNVSAGGTAGKYVTFTLYLIPEEVSLNNYASVDVGNGMSTSEKIR